MIRRLNVIGAFRELGTDKQRRDTMIALASTQLLVQLSSIPIALTIPSVARYFDVDVAQAAWLVIVRLLVLGSTAFRRALERSTDTPGCTCLARSSFVWAAPWLPRPLA